MNQIHIQYHNTQIGELLLGSFDGKICLLNYRSKKTRTAVDERVKKGLKAEFVEKDDAVLETARQQIDEFLSGERQRFDIPFSVVGTAFQKSVWKALQKIPYGTTASYRELAKSIENEKAIRAVGSANGANALSLIIPCHRVIGSDGSLAGYGGGLSAKQHLLSLEKDNSRRAI